MSTDEFYSILSSINGQFDDGCGECSSCCSKRTVDALTFYRDEELRLQGEVEREKARVRTKSIGIAFITFETRDDAKLVASDHRLGNCGACLFWACSFLPNMITQLFCCCGRRPPTSRQPLTNFQNYYDNTIERYRTQ